MNQIPDLIKRLREAGLSQSEISRRTGIPQPRISRWEAGTVPPGATDALKLAQLDRQVSRRNQARKAPRPESDPATAEQPAG